MPWKEYWPFLKDFVDFRSDEGLTKLEKYLEQRFKDYKDQLLYSRMVRKDNAVFICATWFDLRICKFIFLYIFILLQIDLVNKTNTNVPADYQQITEEMDVSEIQDLCEKLRSCSLSAEVDEIEEDEDSGLFDRFLLHVSFYCIIYYICYYII